MNLARFPQWPSRCIHALAVIVAAAVPVVVVPSAHAAAAGEPLTPVISVPSTLNSNQNPGEPSVSATGTGEFTVGWVPAGSRQRFLLRRFDAVGNARGDQFQITDQVLETGETLGTPLFSISTNSRGDQVVAWLADAGVQVSSIVAQVFRADGTPRTAPFEVATTPNTLTPRFFRAAEIQPPSVAINDDGDVMIAWLSRRQSSVFERSFLVGVFRVDDQILARSYSIDGVPYSEARTVDALTTFLPVTSTGGLRSFSDTVQVSAGARGEFAVAFHVVSGLARPSQPSLPPPYRVRILGSDARPLGPVLVLGTLLDGQLLNATPDYRVALAANGDLMLAWAAQNLLGRADGLDQTIYLGRYSRLGLPKGLPARVATRNAPATGLDVNLFIKPIPSGGNVVAWGGGPESAVMPNNGPGVGRGFARYYAANESPLSPAFVISETSSQISIDTDGAGNLITVSSGRSFNGIFAQVFEGP